ncbi:MAG: hypothetical protein NC911_08610 [Candidatus Omnitrophica bacterium]|nr:hypothetical protein [Candidatus Omnitrophota bacterium]
MNQRNGQRYWRSLLVIIWVWLTAILFSENWYKGNLHCHSFWSDGREFPEMVAAWYKENGYHFLALTDHNTVATGEKWANITSAEKNHGLLAACQKRFPQNGVITRQKEEKLLAQLRTFEEVQKLIEEPGRFILIQGEELSAKYLDVPVHVNIININQPIDPLLGTDAASTLKKNVQAALKAAGEKGLVFINHPNYRYALTGEDLAETEACFFEVWNANHWISNNPEDDKHPGTEKLWDIANSLRLLKLKKPLLYGLATDDAHSYHDFAPNKANPGRAFVMVKAKELTGSAILQAIREGNFYSSTGVILRESKFEPKEKRLTVEVQPDENTQYTIEFIGTLVKADSQPEKIIPSEQPAEDQQGKKAPVRFTSVYKPEIGQVFLTVRGHRATYILTGNELFVRAVITSNRPVPWLPANSGIYQKAWTQPITLFVKDSS